MLSESEEKARRLNINLKYAQIPKGISSLDTNPHSFFDGNLWHLSRGYMDKFAEGKLPLGYHYRHLPEDLDFEEFKQNSPIVEGDKTTFSAQSRWPFVELINDIRVSFGAWKERFVVGVDLTKRPEGMTEDEYMVETLEKGLRFCFTRLGEVPKGRYCSIILYSPFIAALGAEDIRVGLLEGNSAKTVPAEVFQCSKLTKNLPLL